MTYAAEEDDDLTDEELRGWCTLRMKDGAQYLFALDEHDALDAAIDTGKAWFVGRGTHGQRIRVKLAGGESLIEWPTEAIRSYRAIDAHERRRKQSENLFGNGE